MRRLSTLPNSHTMLSSFHARAVGRVLLLGLSLYAARGTSLLAQDSTIVRALPPIENHGFIQVYYRLHDPLIKDGYRLRKADFKFNGVLSPRLRWRITFDAAKALALTSTSGQVRDTTVLTGVAIDQKSRILQDAA